MVHYFSKQCWWIWNECTEYGNLCFGVPLPLKDCLSHIADQIFYALMFDEWGMAPMDEWIWLNDICELSKSDILINLFSQFLLIRHYVIYINIFSPTSILIDCHMFFSIAVKEVHIFEEIPTLSQNLTFQIEISEEGDEPVTFVAHSGKVVGSQRSALVSELKKFECSVPLFFLKFTRMHSNMMQKLYGLCVWTVLASIMIIWIVYKWLDYVALFLINWIVYKRLDYVGNGRVI